MKIETWCKQTGWPYDEWRALGLDEAAAILALYDLRLSFKFRRKGGKRV